MPKSLGLKASN